MLVFLMHTLFGVEGVGDEMRLILINSFIHSAKQQPLPTKMCLFHKKIQKEGKQISRCKQGC